MTFLIMKGSYHLLHKDAVRTNKAKHMCDALAKLFINSLCSYEVWQTPIHPLRPRTDTTSSGNLGCYLF